MQRERAVANGGLLEVHLSQAKSVLKQQFWRGNWRWTSTPKSFENKGDSRINRPHYSSVYKASEKRGIKCLMPALCCISLVLNRKNYENHACQVCPQDGHSVGFLSVSKATRPTGKRQIHTQGTHCGYPPFFAISPHFGQDSRDLF